MNFRRLDGLTGVKRILRHFAEIGVGLELFSRVLKSQEAFKKIEVKGRVDGTSGDAEVFEPGADHGDARLGVVEVVAGGEASDDAVGGDDIKDVQILDRGGDQRGMAVVGLVLAARDVGVTLAKSDELLEAEILHTGVAVAPDRRQRRCALQFD